MTVPAISTGDAAGGPGLLPARPLAAQAHALRGAAQFLERTGIAGLPVTADDDGLLIISVPQHAGPPPARTATVAVLAAAIGAPAPARTVFRSLAWVAATGTIAGHRARVTTTIDQQEEQDNP